MVHAEARAAPLRRFPYLVFYLAETSEVLVLAVLHASRHPQAWQARL